MLFSAIPEHQGLKKALMESKSDNRVAHAYLLSGCCGSAAWPLGLAFSTYLNCLSPEKDDACGECLSCISMSRFVHPNVQFVFPHQVGEGHKEYEDDYPKWRIFLKQNPFPMLQDWSVLLGEGKQCQITKGDIDHGIKNIYTRPSLGAYRVVCIWLPECLNRVAANALLKVLEEPPLHTVFVLVSHDLDRVLPTVRSRVQRHNVPLFTDRALALLVQKQFSYLLSEQMEEVVFFARGDYIQAKRYIEHDIVSHFEQFCDWMRSCYSRNFTHLVQNAESFHSQTKDYQKVFFADVLRLVDIILECKVLHKKPRLGRISEFVENFQKVVAFDQIQYMTQLFNQGYDHLGKNANAKMVHMHISLEIARMFHPLG